MKPTTKNRWLKLLAWLLVLVIIVMLLIPSGLTDEQLAEIKPGISIANVKRMLGEPNGHNALIWNTSMGMYWSMERKWWKPSLQSRVEGEAIAFLSSGGCIWFSDTLLLWVEHHNGTVTRAWLFPLIRSGGGLQGCIDTIKQYWNNWRK